MPIKMKAGFGAPRGMIKTPVRIGGPGPMAPAWGYRGYRRRGWGWGGFGILKLIFAVIVLGILAFIVCSIFGFLALFGR